MTKITSNKQQATSRNSNPASCLLLLPARSRGYTLVELIVAVGLFALIMMLATGAYFVMIGINRQVQAMATGINNLSFALETMTRTIRTGTNYSNGGATFSVTDSNGKSVVYALGGNAITQDGIQLTEQSVNVTSLMFYAYGTSPSDKNQARVTIVVSGTVASGPGKTEKFSVETGATMRGSDI